MKHDEKPIEEKTTTTPGEFAEEVEPTEPEQAGEISTEDLTEVSEDGREWTADDAPVEIAEENAAAAEMPLTASGRIGKAKKDFVLKHGRVRIEIKKGEEISGEKVPAKFMPNLRAEGVI